MKKITVSAYGQFSVGDYVGNEPYQNDHQFVSTSFSAGDVQTFYVTQAQYENGFRRTLERLAQTRIAIAGTSRTSPLMTYVVETVPGERPRVSYVTGSPLSLAGGAQNFVLTGVRFVPGSRATCVINSGTSRVTLTATRKGPSGERVTVNIRAPLGAGNVLVTRGADGLATIEVVPAAAGPGANAVAAQINAATDAALYVTAAGGGTGVVGVRLGNAPALPYVHAGAGVAYADLPTANARTRLRVAALRPGNQGNLYNIVVLANAGGGSVVVSGRTITITPAAGAGNHDASVVRDQLNANTTANKLVVASLVGTTPTAGDDVDPVAATYLHGGSGEEPTATLGGVAVAVSAYSDTSITVTTTGAAIGGGGAVAGDWAMLCVSLDEQLLEVPIEIAA